MHVRGATSRQYKLSAHIAAHTSTLTVHDPAAEQKASGTMVVICKANVIGRGFLFGSITSRGHEEQEKRTKEAILSTRMLQLGSPLLLVDCKRKITSFSCVNVAHHRRIMGSRITQITTLSRPTRAKLPGMNSDQSSQDPL
jgi:hypothetical protein